MNDLKSIKQLHGEHIEWMSLTESSLEELKTLRKLTPENLQQDIVQLDNDFHSIQKEIEEHERSLSNMLKVNMDLNDSLYHDHERSRKRINALKAKLGDIRALVLHHRFQ